MKNVYQIIKKPIMTEKSNAINERFNQVAFEVEWEATKPEIKRAVESLFNVKVEKVRTARFYGKHRKYGRKTIARKNPWKKAIVTLKEGFKLDFYQEIK